MRTARLLAEPHRRRHRIARWCHWLGCLFLLASLVPGLTAAQTRRVIGTGSPASCTETALRAALAQGGDLTFACGPEPHTIPISSPLVIAQDTVLDGSGGASDPQQGGVITLDGQGQTQVLRTENSVSLTVRYLTITNGKGAPGAALQARACYRFCFSSSQRVFMAQEAVKTH